MMIKRQKFALGSALLGALLLIGCGGGSSHSLGNASSQAASSAASSAHQISSLVVLDQFGYLPDAAKIALLRNPREGYDADVSYTPGATLRLVNLASGATVYSAAAVAWNHGDTDPVSGDQIWWFDFSRVTASGHYAIFDDHNQIRSPGFRIDPGVYRDLLVQAVRTFYYQRAGFAKELPYAAEGWTDAASHLGPHQDPGARRYDATGDATTARDLRGGWYDAGDYNKYTNWHADYLITLLHTYLENPGIWGDDFGIPESGNGIPDLLDEVKWGMDWLIRMQEQDGSVLSVMGLSHASPPSAATGPSVYGPATTAATLTAAGAFAFGAKVFAELDEASLLDYAADLRQRAEQAWLWALANPEISFRNSDHGVAAGEQEVSDADRAFKKRAAAVYLFAATGTASYREFVDSAYQADPITWVDPWSEPQLTSLLYYAGLPGASASVATSIRNAYSNAMNSNWSPIRNRHSAYRAYLEPQNFTWGSNRTMARKGLNYSNLATFDLPHDPAEVRDTALGYLHYLHGTNPLGMVYLSNMYAYGAHHSVNEFYHSWFEDGSALWDRVGVSTYGPAPGFLVGGPNPTYDWDDCCPNSCGSAVNNSRCTSLVLEPPRNQPLMKSYLDFNSSWPLNSWEISENHNDYQVAYIRLLSKFVH